MSRPISIRLLRTRRLRLPNEWDGNSALFLIWDAHFGNRKPAPTKDLVHA